MKKKIIALCLIGTFATSLCACGEKKDDNTTEKVTETTTETVTEDTEEGTTEQAIDDTTSEDEQKPSSDETIAKQYLAVFDASQQTDADAMVDELLAKVSVEYALDKISVEEGYLVGFDEEIHGFKKGVMFSPIIGTIPFVGYVFETDDAKALLSLLNEKANPAWNICTQADETVSSSREQLVFFLMCPYGD